MIAGCRISLPESGDVSGTSKPAKCPANKKEEGDADMWSPPELQSLWTWGPGTA